MSTTSDRLDIVLPELKVPRTDEAKRVAKCAHEDHFESRRGAFEDDGDGTIRVYDNNPCLYRDAQVRLLVAWLADYGHHVVAADSYPRRGDSAGYTLGLVIRYRSDLTFDAAHGEICDAWSAVIAESHIEPRRPTAWARVSEPTF